MNIKKILCYLIFVLLNSTVFIYSENISKRYVINTEYFDIIYKIPSENTANLIAENIDDIYLKIRQSLNAQDNYHFKHFPIYIEWTTQQLNAYYSEFPFRQIVLFDTAPTEDLMSFDKTIISVLSHELTHAVSMNLKHKFSKVISDIFFDAFGEIGYTAPTSVLEGITVFEESQKTNVGRLNDPYAMHIVKQSLLDNKFPKYQEITGARDINPIGNVPYIFGGAFSKFVVEKYGKSKYSLFIKKCNVQLLNYYSIYKNVFGNKIVDDWNEFKNTIQESIQQENQISQNVSVFEEYKNQKISSCYENPTSFITKEKSGIAWLVKEKNQVWYLEKNQTKPKLIFTMNGISKIKFSSDGKFLTVSRTLPYSTYKNSIKIFDMTKKSFIKFPFENYRDGVVLSYENKYFFAAVKNISQSCSIDIFEFINSKHFNFIKSINFEVGDVPIKLIDSGKNNLGFILKSGLNWSISLYDISLDSFLTFEIPDDIYIRDLTGIFSKSFVSGQQGFLLSFSYAKKHMLPRLAFLSIKTQVQDDEQKIISSDFYFQNKDVSGGIYSPAFYYSSKSMKFPSVIYCAKYFDNSKLNFLDPDLFEFEKISAKKINLNLIENNDSKNQVEKNDDILRKGFNPLVYFNRGIFLPVGLVPVFDNLTQIKDVTLLGLSWLSKNYFVSLGVHPSSKNYGATLLLYDYSETQNFNFFVFGTSIFNDNEFIQTQEMLAFNYILPVLNHSNISFSNNSSFFYGKSKDNFFELEDFSDKNIFTTFSSESKVKFSTVRKNGMTVHEKIGFYFAPFYRYEYAKNHTKDLFADGSNLGFDFGFCLPKLLPFENQKNITLNLPFSFDACVFSSLAQFANFSSSIVLFSVEVQKGTENAFIPLYLNRVYFSACYESVLYYDSLVKMAIANSSLKNQFQKMIYIDRVGLGATIAFTINTGFLEKIGALNVSFDVLYDINQKVKNSNRIHLKLCSQLVF